MPWSRLPASWWTSSPNSVCRRNPSSTSLRWIGFKFRRRGRLRPIFLHNRILEPLYNIECALRAFSIVQSRYPDAMLTVAHDGPSRPALEKFARDIGLRSTTFVGRVPHPRVRIFTIGGSVHHHAGFRLHARVAAGVLRLRSPVIATAAGGIPYIATHLDTAILVPCNDHQAMANWALRLLEDEELVKSLTARAYEECKRYSPVTVAKQWSELYHKLLSRL